jgi:plastocyanin
VSPGGSFQTTFDSEGTFNYICTLHPGSMQATITVTTP